MFRNLTILCLSFYSQMIYGQLLPDWIKNHPIDSNYYVGIGSAKISSDNYRKKALLEALDEISTQIQVKISSYSYLSKFDNNRDFQEEYKSYIIAQNVQDIDNYETVSTFENNDTYWIYVRVSKSYLRKQKENRKQAAILTAKDYYVRSLAFKETGEWIEAVRWLGKAFELLTEFSANPIMEKIGDKEVILQNEIYFELNNALKHIVLKEVGRTNDFIDWIALDTFKVQVQTIPARQCTLIFKIRELSTYEDGHTVKGRVEKIVTGFTGKDGKITFSPFKIYYDDYGLQYDISIDLNAIANTKLPQWLIKTMDVPEIEILCKVRYKNILVENFDWDKKMQREMSELDDFITVHGSMFPLYQEELESGEWRNQSPFRVRDKIELARIFQGQNVHVPIDYYLSCFIEVNGRYFIFHYDLFDVNKTLIHTDKLWLRAKDKGTARQSDLFDEHYRTRKDIFNPILDHLKSVIYP